jgi:hypothetical protein
VPDSEGVLDSETPAGVGVRDCVAESVGVGVIVGVVKLLGETEGVSLVDSVRDTVAVAVSEAVEAGVGVLDCVPEGGSRAGSGVGVAVAVGTTARGTPGPASPAAARLPS